MSRFLFTQSIFYRLIIVFTAVCMTLRTVAAVIPVLNNMFLMHLLLRMTVCTCPAGCITTGVTRLTIVVCPAVSCGERMVKRRSRERICIMAVRALPSKMILRRRMARSTVRQARMVEVGVVKVAGVLVASAASPRKMVGRCAVASRTI